MRTQYISKNLDLRAKSDHTLWDVVFYYPRAWCKSNFIS